MLLSKNLLLGLKIGLVCGLAIIIWQIIIKLKRFFISPRAREFLTMGTHTEKKNCSQYGWNSFFFAFTIYFVGR